MRIATVLVLALTLASGMAYALPLANEPPAADFAWSPALPGDGDVVSFESFSTDADGFIVVHEWDFGDGVVLPVPSGADVQHVYQEPGAYLVRLTVTDQFLGSSSVERTLLVYDAYERVGVGQAPFVDFVWSPSALFAGTAAEFVSQATDPSGRVLLHEWDIPGRDPDLLPVHASVEHAFPRRGEYAVTLTVTDSTADRASLTRIVSVQNTPPVPRIALDDGPIFRHVDVRFGGSATDADGDAIANWTWTFPDGDVAHGRNATRSFSTLGTHTVTLQVEDEAGGGAFVERPVRVVNRPPLVAAQMTPAHPRVGETVVFSAEGFDPDLPGGSVAFTWRFSDGVVLAGPQVSRAFNEAGDRSVTLRGEDSEGATSAPYIMAVHVST